MLASISADKVNTMQKYTPGSDDPPEVGDMVELTRGCGIGQIEEAVERQYNSGDAMDPGSALSKIVVRVNGKGQEIGIDDIAKINRVRDGPAIPRSAGKRRHRKTRRGKSKRSHRKTRARRH